jgi:hypothetical protein
MSKHHLQRFAIVYGVRVDIPDKYEQIKTGRVLAGDLCLDAGKAVLGLPNEPPCVEWHELNSTDIKEHSEAEKYAMIIRPASLIKKRGPKTKLTMIVSTHKHKLVKGYGVEEYDRNNAPHTRD